MEKTLYSFAKELILFAKRKFIINLSLIVGLGLVEGIGILMLLPLLAFAGITAGVETGMAGGLVGTAREMFASMGKPLALCAVLAIYTGIIALHSWLNRYQTVLSTTIQETFGSYLTNNLYRSLTYARWSFFLAIKKADIAHAVTTQLMRVSSGSYFFMALLATGLISLIQVTIAFMLAPYLTLLIVCTGVLLFLLLYASVKEARQTGMNVSEFTGNAFSEMTEHFNGIKEVKSYGIEPAQLKIFETQRENVAKAYIDFTKMHSKTQLLYKLSAAVLISIYYYAAVEIFRVSALNFIIIIVIFARLWPRFSMFHSGLQELVMMLPAFEAVTKLRSEAIAATEKIPDDKQAGRMELRQGIRFADVSFRHNKKNEHFALKNVDFFLPAGSTMAVAGISGSGKSTLADLFIGLLRPDKGEIWIDSQRLDNDTIYQWRQSIGYVPQDAFLLNASIRENLLWACPGAKEQEIWEALKLAAIDDFIRNLPQGLDTEIGDRGIRLSGGERQRIVLARALLRKPSLLILDEATSMLDAENERRIQSAIEGLHGKLTMLIIAHRLSTIRNADYILVMEQGRVIEQGSYQELTANDNSRFYRLACL